MTPATSQTPKHIRKQIGSALWLFALLAGSTPADWTGEVSVYVAGGNVVTDAELAERLAVSPGTIAKWRLRLRAAGVIDWLLAPGHGRVFWIAAMSRPREAFIGMKGAEQKPKEGSGAVTAETLSSVPVTSRWLQ